MSKTMKSWMQSVSQYPNIFKRKHMEQRQYASIQYDTDKPWLALQYHDYEKKSIKKPDELEKDMKNPPNAVDQKVLNQIKGSLVGMAIGDSLGAHVEFRSYQYLVQNPVTDMVGGGTWGLSRGQFTDDTSMALCLANSLVTKKTFNPYDQLVRYKWWYLHGYMSSTGRCFDIGAATSESLNKFLDRQDDFAEKQKIQPEEMDYLSNENLIQKFDVYCSKNAVAGNGALMRLAPVPLFFYRFPEFAVEYSGISGQITHGDKKAYDACRYYGALIVAALRGYTKDQILDKQFYFKHMHWFNGKPLCAEIQHIAEGSYCKKGGYADGIRGKGYIVDALEAALWAFWSDENSFQKGVLAAVNLGNDTDTTAAIYGQLAGACYGYQVLPRHWRRRIYAKKFITNLCKWIAYEGDLWKPSIENNKILPLTSCSNEQSNTLMSNEFDSHSQYSNKATTDPMNSTSERTETIHSTKGINRRYLCNLASESTTAQPMSSSKSAMYDATIEQEKRNSHLTFDKNNTDTATQVPFERLDSNVHVQSSQENFRAVNGIQYSDKASQENNQHRLQLHSCQSILSTGERLSSIQKNSHPKSQVPNDRNLKLALNQCYSERNPDSSNKTLFSTRAGTYESALINNENVNRENDLRVTGRNNLQRIDLSYVPQFHMKHSTDSSLTAMTSPQTANENLASLLFRDGSRPNVSHSKDLIHKCTIGNQTQKMAKHDCSINSQPILEQTHEEYRSD